MLRHIGKALRYFALFGISLFWGCVPQQPGQSPGSRGGLVSFLPFILIIVVFYFLLIAPQRKKQKEQQTMIESVKKGDKIVTVGGIHGLVMGTKEKDDTLVVKVAENTKLEISRASVAKVIE